MQRRVKIKRPFKNTAILFPNVASDHVQQHLLRHCLKILRIRLTGKLSYFWIAPLKKAFSIATIIESTHM